MAAGSNRVTIGITSQTSGLSKGLKSAKGQLGGFQRATSGVSAGLKTMVGGFAAVYGVTKVGGFLKDAISEGREANKVNAQTSTILSNIGKSAAYTTKNISSLSGALSRKTAIDDEQIQATANTLVKFSGLNNAYAKQHKLLERSVTLSTNLQASGLAETKANKLIAQSMTDPVASLKGWEKQGVSFTEAEKKRIKTLQAAGKTQEAGDLIITKSGERFKNAAANQSTSSERLKVTIDNLKESLGTKLIPVVDAVAGFLAKNLPVALAASANAFTKIKAVVSAVQGFFEKYGKAIAITAGVIGALFLPLMIQATLAFIRQAAATLLTNAAWLVYGITVKATAIASKAFAAAQWLVNVALSANPIGLVIIGIVALAAGLVFAYKKSETFRAIVQGVFGMLKGFVLLQINMIRAALLGIGNVLTAVVGFFRSLTSGIKTKITEAVTFVKELPGKIKSAIGDLGGLLKQAGRAVIEGLIKGIGEKIGDLKDKLKSITKLIPFNKGPLSVDKKLLTPAGVAIMQGLIKGIESQEGSLVGTLRGVTKTVAATSFSPVDLSGSGSSSSSLLLSGTGGSGNVYNITVRLDSSMSEIEMGRAYKKAIKAAESVGAA